MYSALACGGQFEALHSEERKRTAETSPAGPENYHHNDYNNGIPIPSNLSDKKWIDLRNTLIY